MTNRIVDMNDTKELKYLLHESIENINDQSFLKTVKDILDQKYEPKGEIKNLPLNRKGGLIRQKKVSIREIF